MCLVRCSSKDKCTGVEDIGKVPQMPGCDPGVFLHAGGNPYRPAALQKPKEEQNTEVTGAITPLWYIESGHEARWKPRGW